MKTLELMVTLWPSFVHFPEFANDSRVSGIRLNSAMIHAPELDREFKLLESLKPVIPLWFDIKGRQLRITEVHPNNAYLDISLNHPIKVVTPTPVLFKAGADGALLSRIEEGGRRLIFEGGPRYMVREGESLHIRHPSLQVFGNLFTEAELAKIQLVRQSGCKRYFLSYVENQRDIDEFAELVGKDSEIWLKIENKRGLEYVANQFRPQKNRVLVAARGDLFVEVDKPHDILDAVKLIIEKDPRACVGSRMLLSVISEPVPSCADLHEMAWLYDIGYRRMMLCDELCLRGDLLGTAVNVFESFRQKYDKPHTRTSSRKQGRVPQQSLLQRLLPFGRS